MPPLDCFRPKMYQLGLAMSFDADEKIGRLLKLSDLAQKISGYRKAAVERLQEEGVRFRRRTHHSQELRSRENNAFR